jgi:hypothetical protein
MAGVLVAGGCAGKRVTSSATGRYISEPRLAKIAPGKSDADWLLMLFGEPSEKRPGLSGGEVWIWTYRNEIEETRKRLIGSARPRSEWYERRTLVELSDSGDVIDAWNENAQSAGWEERWSRVDQ